MECLHNVALRREEQRSKCISEWNSTVHQEKWRHTIRTYICDYFGPAKEFGHFFLREEYYISAFIREPRNRSVITSINITQMMSSTPAARRIGFPFFPRKSRIPCQRCLLLQLTRSWLAKGLTFYLEIQNKARQSHRRDFWKREMFSPEKSLSHYLIYLDSLIVEKLSENKPCFL